ncbi:MAG TPA: hypothetical protein DEO60_01280 [Bacteroidales bacterium]|nr:hypothetical protein [Bacteroidales bacterium]
MQPEIENLIRLAIADGEITEKERSIILRKAEKLGEDKDEVELILDGELTLIKKDLQIEQQNQSESNKKEILNKCPSCGANVASFTTKCSICGGKINLNKDSSSIKELLAELAIVEKEEGKLLSEYGFWGSSHFLEKINAFANKKAAIISFFPDPVSKEKILEFLAKAVPKAEIKSVFQIFDGTERNLHNITSTAWNKKCKEIIITARFSMQDDKKTFEKIETYAKQLSMK